MLVNKASCFSERRAVCGDYQVDDDGTEDCDAGSDGDQCCTRECTLTAGAQCR